MSEWKEKRKERKQCGTRERELSSLLNCVCVYGTLLFVGLSEQVLAFSVLHSSVSGESSKLSSLCMVDDENGGVAQGIQVPSDGRGTR